MVNNKICLAFVFVIMNLQPSLVEKKFGRVVENLYSRTRNFNLKNDWPAKLYMKISNLKTRDYSYINLKRHCISEVDLDILACEYCKVNKKLFIGCLWPAADIKKDKQTKQLIEKYGTILYEKKVLLKNNGPKLFLQEIPEKRRFLERDFYKYFPRDKKHIPIRVLLLKMENDETAIKCKKAVRAFLNLYPYAMHINDTQQKSQYEETVNLSHILFNNNTINFLNFCKGKSFSKFNSLFNRYKSILEKHRITQESICIDGSSVLSIYGLRDVNIDFDFITDKAHIIKPLISWPLDLHNHAWEVLKLDIKDIIYNPKNHFYYKGLKVASLGAVKRFKGIQNRLRDKVDIALINAI